MTWIAEYKFNEAASGTGPTAAIDSAATPINLALTYAGAGAWTSVAAGRGLNCVSGTRGAVTVSGTKIATAITGSKTWALEIVASFPIADSGELLGIWHSNPTYPILHFQTGTQFVIFSSGNEIIEFDQTPLSAGPHVLTLVWDSAQATLNNRFRIYIDGVHTPDSVSSFMALNKTVSVASGDQLRVGQVEAGTPSGSVVYWFAVANHAPADAEVLARATALLADNDALPGSTPVEPLLLGSATLVL